MALALGSAGALPREIYAQTSRALAVVPPAKITEVELNKMNVQQLQDVFTEIDSLWNNTNVERRPEVKIAIEAPFIRGFAKFEVQEAVGAMTGRIWYELRKEEKNMSLKVIEECLNVLLEIAQPKPSFALDQLDAIANMAAKALTTREGQQLVDYMSVIIDRTKARRGTNPSLQEMIIKLQSTPDQVRLRLADMDAFLRKRILGQPEVVDKLMALEWDNQMFSGARAAPDMIYLLGQPGTGKDTTAEAFTDALWMEDGAHEKHMFRLPIMKSRTEMWQTLGSSTGYIGSDSVPPFIDFLISHSGGRYLWQKVQDPAGKLTFRVIQNPEWRGQPVKGYFRPDKAVVFANELHNWSKDNKDIVLKQALEKGYFTINNPNGGLAQIYVPIRFVMASNEGIALVTSREANGQRNGKPLTYEQSLQKWEIAHDDKPALKGEIQAGNGSPNTRASGPDALGTSEEFLNRIPDDCILLMRPLSPEHLLVVVDGGLREFQDQLSQESAFFKKVRFTWDPELVNFVQSYDYMAEDNARPMKQKIRSLLRETLLAAVRDGDLPVENEKKEVGVHLSYEKNDDNTVTLVIRYSEPGAAPREIRKLIKQTEKDRPAPALTAEQIDRLRTLAARLKERVFGIDIIADRIADRLLAIENQRTADSEESRRVSTIVALGLSSTGKTELAKALAAEMLGDESELVTFDFSQIQTMDDFRKHILGTLDFQNNPIKSKFMKAYDRANGKLFVAFDELANVRDPEVLTSLYAFFREPVISTFSDNVSRKMGGVMVLVTGNAGQELYKNVPRDIPMIQQMAAWEDISKRVATDLELQRKILERYFPEPLVNRWSKNNIFFFPPHTFKTLKQLAQMKLAKELKRLADTKSRHGWNIVVPSEQEYTRLVNTIVEEGFSLRYQGASIDSFILEDFGESLESLLLKEKVPSGSTVVLQLARKTAADDEDEPGAVQFHLYVDGAETPLDFAFKRPYQEAPRKQNEEELMITGYHEAGHSLMKQLLLSDLAKPGSISIIPGVTQINDEWVVYEGLAKSGAQIETPHLDRDYFIRRIAVWVAGEISERLVTKNESHTAGKGDDMKRATELAQSAILRYGLSDRWGTQAIPADMTKPEYLASLSEAQKILLAEETQAFLKDGQNLARRLLEVNFTTALVPLGNRLIEEGLLSKETTEAFYAATSLIREMAPTKAPSLLERIKGFSQIILPKPAAPAVTKPRKFLRDDLARPDQVADLNAIVQARKDRQFNSVPPPARPPVGVNAAYLSSLSFQECMSKLTAVGH